ncbi:protoporphyrinogen oxidase [Legionella sp. km535]|uniref:FAD-dependent oxidoreductase n=1 Tax=Legionella sp. km535 TaxID=2498107 RepID=UPI000F8DE0C9|nr:FAD-dependent oxidoreductase [Legionella sp. km535]RUR18381.1 protoporphyrinogen oxidase [Legionella sp. km535]
MKKLPSKVIFIGAGPSALFGARKLRQIADEHHVSIEMLFLEREGEVGGKCRTYSDPNHPELKTELGAGAVASNYGVVIDALIEHGLTYETMVPMEQETVEIQQKYNGLSFAEKIVFVKELISEMSTFNEDYDIYQDAKQNKKQLPEELQRPFTEYCTLREMKHVPLLTKPFVPGFGYGAITHCPTYSVLEYFGKMTLPELALVEHIVQQPALLAIHGGFQLLMQQIARNFDVRLNAHVTHIDRNSDQVTVNYVQNGIEYTEIADALVLATSPKNWPSLGMELTETETNCVKQLEFYRYPVAVYKIKGLPPHQYYFPQGLDEAGFGHLALITTRDNRTGPDDGRLCTVYVNLPPNHNDFTFDHAALIEELKSIEGVTEVEVIKEKIWEDYMSTLPWEVRLELDKEQQTGNTIYLGSYVLGGFEDVVSVGNKATDTMSELFTPSPTYEENFSFKNVMRGIQFFTAPVFSPLNNLDKEMSEKSRCSIL